MTRSRDEIIPYIATQSATEASRTVALGHSQDALQYTREACIHEEMNRAYVFVDLKDTNCR
jgi:hypothetical protein